MQPSPETQSQPLSQSRQSSQSQESSQSRPVDLASPPAFELPAEVAAMLKHDAAGLVAAVIQQFDSLEVLMLGWMDNEALRRTLSSGRVTFFSRSRQEYWRKGDTSGHFQFVKSVSLDCDGDALLITVDQVGAACHTGDHSCFDARHLDAVVGYRSE